MCRSERGRLPRADELHGIALLSHILQTPFVVRLTPIDLDAWNPPRAMLSRTYGAGRRLAAHCWLVGGLPSSCAGTTAVSIPSDDENGGTSSSARPESASSRRSRLEMGRESPSGSLARPAGFEPATPGLGNRCSILLSYERAADRLDRPFPERSTTAEVGGVCRVR